MDKKSVLFLVLFSVAVLVAYQVNFAPLLGMENQQFTLFQFMGPIAGGFLGPVFGAAAVLAASVANFLLVGKEVSVVNLFRLLPMLGAAVFFARRKESVLVPIVCMVAFVLHPVGQQAWYYTLFWLIPIVAAFLPDRLFLRSLGATFTAHALGATIFLYAVPTTVGLWNGLMIVTPMERVLFALGIGASFVVFNTVLDYVTTKVKVPVVSVDKRYVIQLG